MPTMQLAAGFEKRNNWCENRIDISLELESLKLPKSCFVQSEKVNDSVI